MNSKKPVPIFFRHPESMVEAIPTQPTNSQNLNPLITNYLEHYSIDWASKQIADAHEIWQNDINGYRIVEQRWIPIEPRDSTLIVAHGYFDHAALYGRFLSWALSLGFQVHIFDLPGHGLSGGEPAAIESFDRYSEVLSTIVNRESYRHYHLLGHSTGAAVILNHLLNQQLKPKVSCRPEQIFFLAPLVRSLHWQRMRWLYFALNPFIKSIKRNFIKSSHCNEFFYFQKHVDPLQATRIPLSWLGAMEVWSNEIQQFPINTVYQPIIIQGTKDQTVDWQYNLKQIQHCLPNSSTHLIPNAWHNLINESEEYWLPTSKIMDQALLKNTIIKPIQE